jgi:hypothetical protein
MTTLILVELVLVCSQETTPVWLPYMFFWSFSVQLKGDYLTICIDRARFEWGIPMQQQMFNANW